MSLLFKEGRHGMIARDHEGGAEGGVEKKYKVLKYKSKWVGQFTCFHKIHCIVS